MNKFYNLLNTGTVFSLFLQVVPITLAVGIVYAVLRCIHIKKQGHADRFRKEAVRLLFVCYLTGLFNLVLVPADLWMYIWAKICIGYSHIEISFFTGSFNLVPTVFKWMAGELTVGRWVFTMLLYNCLMFMPFGFFLPLVFEKADKRSIWATAAAVPVAVEILQPALGRSFDTDDLILNFLGIAIGICLATWIKTPIQQKK